VALGFPPTTAGLATHDIAGLTVDTISLGRRGYTINGGTPLTLTGGLTTLANGGTTFSQIGGRDNHLTGGTKVRYQRWTRSRWIDRPPATGAATVRVPVARPPQAFAIRARSSRRRGK
jgi:hypothetical protein